MQTGTKGTQPPHPVGDSGKHTAELQLLNSLGSSTRKLTHDLHNLLLVMQACLETMPPPGSIDPRVLRGLDRLGRAARETVRTTAALTSAAHRAGCTAAEQPQAALGNLEG